MDKLSIKEELLKTIDEFYQIYKLPPNMVSEDEWDVVLNVIEKHFLEHNIGISDYEYAVNLIMRKALSIATVSKDDSFNIKHIIKALDNLSAYQIFLKERLIIQEEVAQKCLRKV